MDNIPKGYKKTEIGMIPEDWVIFSTLDLITPNGIKIGPFGSQLKKDLLTEYGYKVYGQENVYSKDMSLGDRYISKGHFEKLRSCELKGGDFIISMMGTIGKCMIVPLDIQQGIMDSHLLRLKLNKNIVNPKVLEYLLSSDLFLKQIDKLSVGGIMDGLSSTIIKQISFALPSSIDEQENVATTLSDIDSLITSLEKLIDKKKLIKQGVMQEFLTGKRRLKGFSGEWKKVKLGDICVYMNGKSYENKISDYGKYYLITLNSLDINGKLKSNHLRINKPNEFLSKDDIVMILSDVAHGYFLGLTDVIPENEKYVLNQRVGALRSIKAILPKYLSFYINVNQKYFKTIGQGSSQQNINRYEVLDFTVFYPPKEEQVQILNVLLDLDSEIEKLKTKRSKLKTIKAGAMQQLLTGKIRLINN